MPRRHENYDRWTPEKIETLRKLVALKTSNSQCGKIMGVSKNAIAGARLRYKIATCVPASGAIPLPDDFREVIPTITRAQACRRWKVSETVVSRWVIETGIRPYRRPVNAPKPKEPRGYSTPYKMVLPERDGTRAGLAQSYLQRFFPVFRAKIIDPTASNDTWIVGGRRMPEEEMVTLAAVKGFQVAA